ncbi:MAG: terminase family protein [Pseudomonadota bacterium]
MQHELKSVSDLLGSASAEQVEQFLDMLSDNALLSLPYLFEHWAHRTHQLPPVGDWTTWVVLGGRGAGKTRTGAEWIRSRLEGATPTEPGLGRRAALVAETQDQAREVMVFGDSGILACSPPDRRPEWVASKRKLVWPNGSEAQCFSASDPEGLRGPQFDTAWCDELAKWKKAEPAWDMLQFCMRLGQDPRTVVTTTPRSTRMLRALLDEKTTVKTSAPTEANKLYLAESFLEKITAKYRNTRLGRQELNGELLTDTDGALWSLDMLEAARVDEAPEMDRIVVAVDPPVTSGPGADACGIIVAGVVTDGPPQNWKAYVLEDATIEGVGPSEWAGRALEKVASYLADRLVAEVNQGGELVESVIRGIDPFVPFTAVRASRAKGARAEPVAALYEQGRIKHVGALPALEDQMTQMARTGYAGRGSPDRLDALVWAIQDLMIGPAAAFRAPRVRSL